MIRTSNKAPSGAARNSKSKNSGAGAGAATDTGADASTINPTAAAPEPHATEPAVAPTAVPKAPSKQQQLAGLLVRDEGATLDQMIAATGWLPHTTRAALTGLKKKGYAISSDKVHGARIYRAVAPE